MSDIKYRALANVNRPDAQIFRGQVLSQEDYDAVPDKYKFKFEEISVGAVLAGPNLDKLVREQEIKIAELQGENERLKKQQKKSGPPKVEAKETTQRGSEKPKK